MPIFLDPITRKFVADLTAKGGPPIYTLSPADARNVLESLQKERQIELADAIIDQVSLPVGPTGHVNVRIVRSPHVQGNPPVIMYFHGGGWILGSFNTHERLVREIAHASDAAVVFVEYDRSPEARFPDPVEQCYAATKFMADNGGDYGLDGSRLAVVGDSVGGNMAAVVSLLANQRTDPPRIACQVLFYPVTDANFDTASYREFADGPWLTRAAMEWFWDAYAPDPEVRKEPMASPLQASTAQLRGTPPTLLIVDENDVLRDEGEAFAHKLMEADVEVTAFRQLGIIHDFVMLNPLAESPATRNAISVAVEMLFESLIHPVMIPA